MKRIINLFITAAMFLSISTGIASAQKISIFCDHIDSIARQEGITFAEAAAKVREIGYNGVDVEVTIPQEKIQVLDELGFEYACAIAHMNYSFGPQPEMEQRVLDLLKERGFKRLLIVPDLMTEATNIDDVVGRVVAFAKRTEAIGTITTVEDYDNAKSPCYNIALIGKFLNAYEGVGHAFDTGNYLFAGEDCIKALQMYHKRIAHVHLKDRRSASDLSCPAVGTGCIPIIEVIKFLMADGYDGWFTVEEYGSRQMLKDATESYANVKAAMELKNMRPQMTEYYYPEVPVVEPLKTSGKKPAGAKYLFKGKDLSAWCAADGSEAKWTLNKDKSMTVNKKAGDIRTKEEFGSFQLHVEWMIPADIEGSGQSRGNSGVYLQNLYEVQVLDSYQQKTYVNGQAGSLYKQSVPLANPCRKPGEWNYYDITFTAPVLAADGSFIKRPRVTVYFNGVLVQDDFELLGTTEYIGLPRPVKTDRGPILLQSHGDPSKPISFRNIWIKEL